MKSRSFYIIFSILLIAISCFSQKKQTISSVKTELSNSKSDTLSVNLLNRLGKLYLDIDKDSSIYFLNKALSISREIEDSKYKVSTYINLGRSFCSYGEYLKALEYLDIAENILNESPNQDIEAILHFNKAIVFISIDKINLANKSASKALQLAQNTNNIKLIGAIYPLFGTIYIELEEKEKSIEYFVKSYEISLQLNDSARIFASLNNLGSIYLQTNQLDSAYLYMRKLIHLNEQNPKSNLVATNYHNLSELFYKKGLYDSANIYIRKASEIYRETGYMIHYYKALDIKARIALKLNDTSAAIQHYTKIIDSPHHLESLKTKISAYMALHEIAFHRREYEEANAYYKLFKQFDDSLKKETNTSLLLLMDLKLKYEKQHIQLEFENKEVKLISQRKNFFLILLVGIILLLGIIVFYMYRLHKEKARAILIEKQLVEDELDYKKREITTNVMALLKKNEILSEISTSLLELENQAVKIETKEAIIKISKKIRKTRDVEIWEEFDIRFKQVHNDFYNNLLHEFPGLSPSEHRLCAFLRMNMSTKDISELTGTHSRSIDNARSKIRKKLGLNSDDNLVSFLSKI